MSSAADGYRPCAVARAGHCAISCSISDRSLRGLKRLLAVDSDAPRLAHARLCRRRGRRNCRTALFCRMDKARRKFIDECRNGRPKICAAGAAQAALAVGRDRIVSGAGSPTVSVAIVDYGSGNLHSAAKALSAPLAKAGMSSRSRSPAILKLLRALTGLCCRSRRIRRLPARP